MADLIRLADTHMGGEFVWGERDCCTSACDMLMAVSQIDPMWSLRGKYHNSIQAMRRITERGGWLQMAQRLADDAGMVKGDGCAGEIGLTVANSKVGRALVFSGGRMGWFGKTQDGYMLISSNHIERSWRCHQ